MRYQVFVSGTPAPATRPIGGDGWDAYFGEQREPEAPGNRQESTRGLHRETAPRTPQTFLRRFPPVLQFLKQVDPLFEQQAQALVLQWYRKGMTLEQVCDALHEHARMLGYEATLGVQEVFSASMPSFPNQTVTSALLMIDLNRIEAPEGFHRRVAV